MHSHSIEDTINQVNAVAKSKIPLTEDVYNQGVDMMTALLRKVLEEHKKEKKKEVLSEEKKAYAERQKQIVETLRILDERYVKDVLNADADVIKTVILTRHGLCHDIWDKGLGLIENASLNNGALDKMSSITHIIMQGLLSGETVILISPLVRAEQTAGAIIPENCVASVSIDPFLAESSKENSGQDIINATSLHLKTVAKQAIRNKVKLDDSQDKRSLTDPTPKPIDDAVKVNYLHNQISKMNDNSTLWMIGHGKISTIFIAKELGLSEQEVQKEDKLLLQKKGEFCDETNFTFGEIKKIIYYKNAKGELRAFLPPYSLVINQKNGLVDYKKVMKLEFTVEYNPSVATQTSEYKPSSAATASSASTSSTSTIPSSTPISSSVLGAPPRPASAAPPSASTATTPTPSVASPTLYVPALTVDDTTDDDLTDDEFTSSDINAPPRPANPAPSSSSSAYTTTITSTSVDPQRQDVSARTDDDSTYDDTASSTTKVPKRPSHAAPSFKPSSSSTISTSSVSHSRIFEKGKSAAQQSTATQDCLNNLDIVVTNDKFWKGKYISEFGISSTFSADKFLRAPVIKLIADKLNNKGENTLKEICDLVKTEKNNPNPRNQHLVVQEFLQVFEGAGDVPDPTVISQKLSTFIQNYNLGSPKHTF